MQISIIIVNYNVRYFLEQALMSVLKASEGMDNEIWVVDNNSSDDSVRMVSENFPNIKLIANKENVGFSKANNQAIKECNGKYVLLLNPGTVIEENTLKKCYDFMERTPDAGGLGVRMIDGAGKFLPESKRGFPTPFVAFCKTFGLSKFFPKSKIFNRYHLGYLPENETNEIEVLAGAFMLMPKAVLEKVGLLDEAFFMYGEDIDLSYRITKGGFKNYYFPETTIIHYKGESTKKGSLNYVKTFYQAMIIFAKKHFQGTGATFFVLMLQMAIYLRASITLISNVLNNLFLPLIDATLIFFGMYFLKDYWAKTYYHNADYYPNSFLYFNIPLYITVWQLSVYFRGGYDEKYNLKKIGAGLLTGTILVAAVYGLLDLQYRTSRALIVMSAFWAAIAMMGLRLLIHFIKFGHLDTTKIAQKNIVIIGEEAEIQRVKTLLNQALFNYNLIGKINPNGKSEETLSELAYLEEVISIYSVNEVIFCAKDISAETIMYWMNRLGSKVVFRILPESASSIIGSSSKDTSGELYTVEINYKIAQKESKRNKRLLDVLTSILFLFLYPILLFLIPNPLGFLKNIGLVFMGNKTWVGYFDPIKMAVSLPKIRQGVLSKATLFSANQLDDATKKRINFFYAKDYDYSIDVGVIWKGWKGLGGK
jgi:GT2 family glycosyltransferase